MKHVNLSLAVVAMALTTGCSQSEVLEESSPRSDRSITFSNYLVRPNSRATEVKIEELKTVGFKVWSYLSTKADGADADLGEANNTVTAHALDGTSVFKWDTNAWKPTDNATYYWPEDGKGKLSFFAMSTSNPEMIGTVFPPNGHGSIQIEYGTNAHYEAEQNDLVAAQLCNQTFGSNNGTVNLTFKHVLSQVRFAAKTATTDFKAKILSIKVLGVERGGLFTFDPTNATAGGWQLGGGSGDNYTYFDATTVDAATFPAGYPKDDADRDQPTGNENSFITTTTKDIWLHGGTKVDNGALMFVPHTNAELEGKSLEISYQCYVLEDPANKPGVYVKEGEVVKRTIPLTREEQWPINKIVCYNLTLTMPMEGYVSYNATIEPWNDPNSDVEYHP